MTSEAVAQQVKDAIANYRQMRVKYERTWYDNNYFDDGFHFRYVSRNTGRIIDKTNASNAPNKMRAIPKASKQIRGIANLLTSTNPHPVLYPERQLISKFNGDVELWNQAKKMAQEIAKKQSHWLNNEMDEDEVINKLTEIIILACKNSVAYLKVTPDPINEEIIASVRDAFDVFLMPTVKDVDDSPIMGEAVAVNINDILSNPLYSDRGKQAVVQDNLLAESKIKDSYLRQRFGTSLTDSKTGTAIIYEVYIKEHLDDQNYEIIKQQKDADLILAKKKMGQPIIRQLVCTSLGVPLYDHYTSLSIYPYADFRLEPGYIYQVSQIERFIPANKSLDAVMSRLEGWVHTMGVGIWAKKKGEGFRITNQFGGQVAEYTNTPPQAVPPAAFPNQIFNFIALINGFIEEQGLTMNTLAQVPTGVKAFKAIESLKQSELNNLQIPLNQLHKTVKRIAQIYLEYGSDYFVKPHEVPVEKNNDTDYFDVIGENAFKKRESLGISNEGIIPIKKDSKIKIEVDNNAAYTEEGKRSQLLDLMNTLAPLFAQQILPPEVLKIMAQELLDSFKVGSLQEVLEALDTMQPQGSFDDQDIAKVKLGVLQVMNDLKKGGQEIPNQNPPLLNQPQA